MKQELDIISVGRGERQSLQIRGRSLAAERRDGRLGTWTLGRLLRRFRVDRKQLKGKNNKRQSVSYSIFYVRPLFQSINALLNTPHKELLEDVAPPALSRL